MGRKVTRVAFNVPEIPKKKNVAAYCRVSSGKDAMLHSLAAQVSYYSELIQSHGEWEYAGVYADEAKTEPRTPGKILCGCFPTAAQGRSI